VQENKVNMSHIAEVVEKAELCSPVAAGAGEAAAMAALNAAVEERSQGWAEEAVVPDSLRWYAAYTHARHEKAVARQLGVRQIEAFLPLFETVHSWKGRRAEVRLPFFPGYVFVRIPQSERSRVLQVPGVAHLVGGGRPTPLADSEVEAVRKLCSHTRACPHPFLSTGRRARVLSGPLAGLEGLVLRRKGNLRFILSVDLIQRSVAVELDAAELEPLLARTSAAAVGRG
jgi:transcription antitermination factor NusG